MECKFVVGQKVVCINDDRNAFKVPGLKYRENGLDGLTKGKIYTIRDIFQNPRTGYINLELHEIVRDSGVDPKIVHLLDSRLWRGYVHLRFAPLKEKKTDISVFTSILNKVNAGNHDNKYNFNLDELYETEKK